MKRLVAALLAALVVCAALCGSALASGKDYSVEGSYRVKSVIPKDHKYSYIYAEPSSTQGENLGRVDDGKVVYVYYKVRGTGDYESWWGYCTYDDLEGYIRFDNLVPVGTGYTAPDYDYDDDDDDWYDYGDYVRFSGDCNVRTGPGLGYSSIGTVTRYDTLPYAGGKQIDDRGVAWYSVYYGNRTAWVSSVFASISGKGGNSGGGSYSGSGSYVESVAGDSNVRTGPGLGYGSLGVMYRGMGASYAGSTSYDDRGVAWYKIYWDGGIAWVSSMYTELY